MPPAENTLPLRERFDPRRFLRGDKAVRGPIRLTHRRIFILPNRRGMALGLLVAIQLLVATNYNNNLAFVLCFLLLSIALVGILHSFRNLSGLVIGPAKAEAVFAGDIALFEVMIDNPSDVPRISVDYGLARDSTQRLYLSSGTNAVLKIPMPAPQRGRLRLATVTFSSTFPLGLFRAWSPINLDALVLVYPKPAPPGLTYPESSGPQGKRPTQDDDFQGFQNYHPGDPLKRIHWQSLARGQGLHVKAYGGGEQHELMLDWQLASGASIEARLSQLCRWIIDAEQSGYRYGLRLPGKELALGAGPAHWRQCLEALALFGS